MLFKEGWLRPRMQQQQQHREKARDQPTAAPPAADNAVQPNTQSSSATTGNPSEAHIKGRWHTRAAATRLRHESKTAHPAKYGPAIRHTRRQQRNMQRSKPLARHANAACERSSTQRHTRGSQKRLSNTC